MKILYYTNDFTRSYDLISHVIRFADRLLRCPSERPRQRLVYDDAIGRCVSLDIPGKIPACCQFHIECFQVIVTDAQRAEIAYLVALENADDSAAAKL
jgi:hypothetical protein